VKLSGAALVEKVSQHIGEALPLVLQGQQAARPREEPGDALAEQVQHLALTSAILSQDHGERPQNEVIAGGIRHQRGGVAAVALKVERAEKEHVEPYRQPSRRGKAA
jgi:hypothetical protein